MSLKANQQIRGCFQSQMIFCGVAYKLHSYFLVFIWSRDTECPTDGSLAGYSGFFVPGKQTDIGNSVQVDNTIQESNVLNELGNNAYLNSQLGKQYLYQQFSTSNLQDDVKLKSEMVENLQGDPGVYQVITDFEAPKPMSNGGHQAWISSSGPCGIAMYDGNSYHQVRNICLVLSLTLGYKSLDCLILRFVLFT